MIGRLVYEVRLSKTAMQPRAAKGKPWRWDVTYYKTYDPIDPGVEDGRWHLGADFGYTRWRWQALLKIADSIQNNHYKKTLVEV